MSLALTLRDLITLGLYPGVTAPAALTLGTNLTDYSTVDSSWQGPVYYVEGRRVYIEGTFRSDALISAGDTVATLPANFRPAKRLNIGGVNYTDGTFLHFYIDPTGIIVLANGVSIASGKRFSFPPGVSFRRA